MEKRNFTTFPKRSEVLVDDNSILKGIPLEDGYVPSEKEEYMCDKHLRYFQLKLLEWRELLIVESEHTLESLKSKNMQEPDDSDRATQESDTTIEIRTRERYLKLINKIDIALRKIEEKSFGYCDETEEEIGLRRLGARPIANYSIEVQEAKERRERLMKDKEEEESIT